MKFFKDEKQRNLWIRLNAEHIRYANEQINGIVEQNLGDIDEPYTYLWVSNNQLEYDEEHRDAPRLSLEELAALSQDEILKLSRERNRETIRILFEEDEYF